MTALRVGSLLPEAISGVAWKLAIVLAVVGLGTRLLAWLIRKRALAIRSVGRRLNVLLVIATAVPVVLMAVLWALSSYLGIATERAEAARGQVVAVAQALHDEVALALAQPGQAEARLRELAASPDRRHQGLTVWLGRGVLRRVAGDASVDSISLATLPTELSGRPVVVVGGRAYLCARVRSAGDTTLAGLALLPFRGVLSDEIERRVDARFVFQGQAGQTVSLLPSGVGAGARHTSAPALKAEIPVFVGFANLRAWTQFPEGWQPTDAMLTMHVDLWPTLAGFIRRARTWNMSLIPLALIGLLVFAGVRIWFRAAGLMRALGRSITAAVAALRSGANALEAGRLEHRIPVAGDDELWGVAAAFNTMADGLERGRQLELDRERIESELALARRIQSRLLPRQPPRVAGMDVAGVSEPARAVGGDYFDHIVLPDGRLALVVADVSGKGVPAALLMSAFRASLLGQLDGTSDPARVMERVNRFLHHSVEPGRFVTAFLGVVDPRRGRVEYCNAGHNPPYIVTPAGEVSTLEVGGLLLGMLEDGPYETGTAELGPGTLLALFTDGVTEAQAADGAMWGEDALVEMLRRHVGEPCPALARRIVDEVRRFEGDQGPSDDITLLLARLGAGGGGPAPRGRAQS
ncbi:MAG TPA: SpoIIE family protein phosphatase [Terriglobales bacterium]|nr:SpoIIE family protein phosphatase [Terriglobales bacterium]